MTNNEYRSANLSGFRTVDVWSSRNYGARAKSELAPQNRIPSIHALPGRCPTGRTQHRESTRQAAGARSRRRRPCGIAAPPDIADRLRIPVDGHGRQAGTLRYLRSAIHRHDDLHSRTLRRAGQKTEFAAEPLRPRGHRLNPEAA